jgi:hypothetical protein
MPSFPKNSGNASGYPPPSGKLPQHLHLFGAQLVHQIIQNAIGDMLIKDAHIPVLKQVKFQGFQLNDFFVRGVFYGDGAKVRKARHGADRCELRLADHDVDVSFFSVLVVNGVQEIGLNDVRGVDFIGCWGFGGHVRIPLFIIFDGVVKKTFCWVSFLNLLLGCFA